MPWWRLIGETVLVTICVGRVVIRHAGEVVADHALCPGRRQRIVDRAHFAGVAGADGAVRRLIAPSVPRPVANPPPPAPPAPAALLRPLAEYAAAVGGGW